MTDVYAGPFGTYTGAEVCAAAGQAEIIANIVSFAALLGLTISGNAVTVEAAGASHPDFNRIPQELRHKIGVELAAICVKIDAMPVA